MHILKIFCIVFILFFPGKQRCWRWRLLLNIKCQLFLNCSCRSAVQCKLRPPPFLASSAQCSLVQLSSSQPAPGCSQREKLYNFRSIEGRHYSTVQCTVCTAIAASCRSQGRTLKQVFFFSKREHSYMTSDDVGVFLTYLLAGYSF